MRHLLILFLIAWPSSTLFSQALTGINFRDLYDPESEVTITLQPVRAGQKIQVYYKIQSKTLPLEQFSISWEKRESYTHSSGTSLTNSDTPAFAKTQTGLWAFDVPAKPWLLVAKVTSKANQKSWVNFKRIEANYPVSGWVEHNNERLTRKYLTIDQPFTIKTSDTSLFYVSWFNEDFPAAYPPFAESQSKADRFMFHDSTFQVRPGSPVSLPQTGLYLFQQDTSSAEGFAVRAVNKVYPRFSSIEDLINPLIFICTQDEFAELQNSKGDKSKFDKVILDITRDRERASNFMKSYFRRIELANLFFISYKEGWKTDRGMIYLIFGLPDEVSMNDGNEVWYYKTSRTRFTFVKSGSVYDPENFVLIRDKHFMEPWFSTIDLWRKSRF